MQEKDRGKGSGAGSAGPRIDESGRAAALAKQQRQAAALRANLKRRKVQQRERAGSKDDAGS